MIINRLISNVLIIGFFLNDRNHWTSGDCGLPAIPESTKLSLFKSRYAEQSVISYECEETKDQLIEGKHRQCLNHRWNGSLPRCAKEVEAVLLKRIEITEMGGRQPLYREMKWSAVEPRRMARIVNNNAKYDTTDCPKTRFLWSVNQSQSWTFHVLRGYYFNYFSLRLRSAGGSLRQLYDQNRLQLSATMEDIISSKRCLLERFRAHDTDPLAEVISFVCDKSERQMIGAQEGVDESIEKIVVRAVVAVDDHAVNITTTFCDLRLYVLSESCGSPEKPLNSDHLVREKTYTVFTCREGFHLVGHQRVRCSPDGQWLDPFPRCLPNKTCPIPAIDRPDPNLFVQYKHFYDVNGSQYGVPDDLAIYSCVNTTTNATTKQVIGPISRVCRDGKWTGSQPVCDHANSMGMPFQMNYPPLNRLRNFMSSRLFVVIIAMFGSFFVGAVSVSLVLYWLIKRRRERQVVRGRRRPHPAIMIDDTDESQYERPLDDYSSLRISAVSGYSNEIMNPMYEDFEKFHKSLGLSMDDLKPHTESDKIT